MKLEAIKDIHGIIERSKGDVFDYTPWDYPWQDQKEAERVQKGLFVHCFGMGEFEVLREGEDVVKH